MNNPPQSSLWTLLTPLLMVHWHRLRRDTAALVLTFILPLGFFSIFAGIFGAMSDGSPSALRIGLVDEDQSALSRRFTTALGGLELLNVVVLPTRAAAVSAVRQGDFGAALVLQSGFAANYGNFDPQQARTELLFDAANPALRYGVRGIVQGIALGVAPDVLLARVTAYLATQNAPITAEQARVFTEWLPYLRGERSWHAHVEGAVTPDADVLPMILRDVRAADAPSAANDASNVSPVAYYAAGIGVMFLLFSMAGASSLLLEDRENGTVERLLNAGVTLNVQLIGHALFFTLLGTAQVWLMFAWGALVFGLDLSDVRTLAGVLLFTPLTAAAACAFAMALATSCTTRTQLNGLSSIVILLMSALGGSMVPRFLMPPWMEPVALFTFNGWALDGFLKIFWFTDPDLSLIAFLTRLTPQVAMLIAMMIGFLGLARTLARRWMV